MTIVIEVPEGPGRAGVAKIMSQIKAGDPYQQPPDQFILRGTAIALRLMRLLKFHKIVNVRLAEAH